MHVNWLILSIFFIIFQVMAQKSDLSFAKANNKFALDMYKCLSKKSKDNVLFSPLSAHAVLSMTYQGATGETAKIFAETLHTPDKTLAADGYKAVMKHLNDIKQVTLLMANKAYVAKGFKLKASFEAVVKEKFLSEVQALDFNSSPQAAEVINSWVKAQTKEKIQQLFGDDSFNSGTRLVLVNAIYFKGDWANKFNRSSTRTEPFFLDEKQKIDCQMMHITEDFKLKYDDNLNAKILEMPYTDKNVSMFILLPYEKNGIADLEAKLANADLSSVLDGLQKHEVQLALPKFKIEATIDLKETLEELGLGGIFDGSNSNFSEMIDSLEPFVVSKVIQKAFIEVNEEGAEAAAATGVTMAACSASINPVFYANHPFIIFLKCTGENDHVLFSGRVSKPIPGDPTAAPRQDDVYDTDQFAEMVRNNRRILKL